MLIKYCKNKKVNKIGDIDVNEILISKKNHTVQRIYLNILLDIMMIMLLEHYV